MTTTEEFLTSIYYNPKDPASFGSLKNLFNRAKEAFPQITENEVRIWLRKQLTYTLHKPVRRRFRRNKIIVSYIDEQWQADLADMSSVANKNKGFKYILTVVDVFSKYAWAIPIPSKKPEEIVKAFKEIFKQRTPKLLQTDKGTEFVNAKVKHLMKAQNVLHFVSQNPDIKCSVVERFNRTLKGKIFKYFTAKNTNTYFDILPYLLTAYNNSKHRSTKVAPSEVSLDNQNAVFKQLYNNSSKRQLLKATVVPKLKINDTVRISKHRGTFEKGYLPQWSEEVFKIKKGTQKHTKPLYNIIDEKGDDIKGTFYPEEVQLVTTTPDTTYRLEKIIKQRKVGRKTQYFVKWKGYPESFNSWVDSSDIVKLS